VNLALANLGFIYIGGFGFGGLGFGGIGLGRFLEKLLFLLFGLVLGFVLNLNLV